MLEQHSGDTYSFWQSRRGALDPETRLAEFPASDRETYASHHSTVANKQLLCSDKFRNKQ